MATNHDFNLLVVIVNYRTPELTIACLESLESELINGHVAVVEGGSGDDSQERIRAAIMARGWIDWVTLLSSDENRGFAAGNNLALRQYLQNPNPPELIWLLNPDTVVIPGALRELRDFMATHSEVGVAGSRLEDPDGTPQCSAFRFPSPIGEFERGLSLGVFSRLVSPWVITPPIPTGACRVGWLSGASMIIRKAVLDEIGLLDESFFLYYEEVDFCLQAKRAGWELWYVPTSRVVHLVGQASGFSDSRRAQPRRPQYWFDSRRHYYRKNHGAFIAFLADVALLAGYFLRRVRHFFQRKKSSAPPRFLLDLWRNLFFNKP